MKLTKLTLGFIAILALGVLMVQCTKEGPAGPAGTDGTDGTDGVDGNVTCLECHSENAKNLIWLQFTESQHASGAIAVDYAGGRGSCAPCHSHELYLEYALTGSATDKQNPSAWQCSTCHDLHNTFESTDYAFRMGGSFTLMSDGTTTVDEGSNNVCMQCHQARRDASYYDSQTTAQTYTRKFTGSDIAVYTTAAVGPAGSSTLNGTGDTLTVVFDVPTTHVYISSTHAGPHHGPQGNVFLGEGTKFSAHAGGCVVCHMNEKDHSFEPKEEACLTCHSSVPEAAMDAIQTRIDAIGAALEAAHAIHLDDATAGYTMENVHPVYASIERDVFNAFWNFMTVVEDRSMSAHNPTYVKALLTECETALGL